jgi:hypothetical protein
MYEALLIEWCILDHVIRVVFIPQVINNILCKLQPQFYPKLELGLGDTSYKLQPLLLVIRLCIAQFRKSNYEIIRHIVLKFFFFFW